MSNEENDIVSKLQASARYGFGLSPEDARTAIAYIESLEARLKPKNEASPYITEPVDKEENYYRKRGIAHIQVGDSNWEPKNAELRELYENFRNQGIPVPLSVLRTHADAYYNKTQPEDKPDKVRKILHVTAGDENWHPTQPELEKLSQKFLTASLEKSTVVSSPDCVSINALERNEFTKDRTLHILFDSTFAEPERKEIEGMFKTALSDGGDVIVIATRNGVVVYWM